MTVTRRQALIGLGVAAGAAAVALVLIQRRREAQGHTPAWNDPQQPPTGTGGQPMANDVPLPARPTPAASWGAVRPGSPRINLGSNVMREYPGTLVDDPESLVR